MPATKRKRVRPAKAPAAPPKSRTNVEKKARTIEITRQSIHEGVEARFDVDTSNSLAFAVVTLSVRGDERRMNPDQPVVVQIRSRFPEVRGFVYPWLTVRASELDDIAEGLLATIAEGRKRFVLPDREDPDKTLHRIDVLKERAAATQS